MKGFNAVFVHPFQTIPKLWFQNRLQSVSQGDLPAGPTIDHPWLDDLVERPPIINVNLLTGATGFLLIHSTLFL